jgi:hypothetical protein
MSTSRLVLVVVLSLMVMPLADIAAQDIPLVNWQAPPSWSPAGTISAMADVSGALPFIAVTPCRVYDSRATTILPAATNRTINMDVAACGPFPSPIRAWSTNITVTGSAPSSSNNFLTAWPAGATRPNTSTINFLGGAQVANAAVVPAGVGNDISIYASTATHVLIDINGYYSDNLNPARQLAVVGSYNGAATILGVNNSATNGSHAVGGYVGSAAVVHGIQGQAGPSTLGGSSGVHGINNSSASGAFGVFGRMTSTSGGGFSAGVRGQSSSTSGNGIGVWGSHAGSGWGGYFTSATGWAVYASTGASNAVRAQSQLDAIYGRSLPTTGIQYGVWGETESASSGAAGVLGTDGNGKFNPSHGLGAHGVLGLSQTGPAILGLSLSRAVQGSVVTVASGVATYVGSGGVLGYSSTSGVHAFGNITASGTKSFVEPHPSQAGEVINYIALEGPEAGTYFRGRGRFVGGQAVISVPEHFRFSTFDDGLTVQITPIGDFAQVAVTSTNLNIIMVKSSKDVEFYYQVNGVRQAHPRHQPIHQDEDLFFVPMSADDRLEQVYGEENRRRLVANGTFNVDGSVNLPTAERLGWAQQWREREAAERTAAEAAVGTTDSQQQ